MDPNPNGARCEFDVGRHGFQFNNSWTAKFVWDIPKIGEVDFSAWDYGLCGGMVYAAADSYMRELRTGYKTDSPHQTSHPNKGSKLAGYIWDRQIDSLKAKDWMAVRTLIKWMMLPTGDKRVAGRLITRGTKALSRRQFKEKIVPSVAKNRPVPLLLVRCDWDDYGANLLKKFSVHHQVLAIGYQPHILGNGKRTWDVIVYDPNYEEEECLLHIHSRRHDRIAQPDEKIRRFRGFFVTRYTAKKPYWASH